MFLNVRRFPRHKLRDALRRAEEAGSALGVAMCHALPTLRDRGNHAQPTAAGDMEQGVGRERTYLLSEVGRQVHRREPGLKVGHRDNTGLCSASLPDVPVEAPRPMMTSPTAGRARLAWPHRLHTLAPARRRPPQEGVEQVTLLLCPTVGLHDGKSECHKPEKERMTAQAKGNQPSVPRIRHSRLLEKRQNRLHHLAKGDGHRTTVESGRSNASGGTVPGTRRAPQVLASRWLGAVVTPIMAAAYSTATPYRASSSPGSNSSWPHCTGKPWTARICMTQGVETSGTNRYWSGLKTIRRQHLLTLTPVACANGKWESLRSLCLWRSVCHCPVYSPSASSPRVLGVCATTHRVRNSAIPAPKTTPKKSNTHADARSHQRERASSC